MTCPVRTFYARYWEDPIAGNTGDGGGIANGNEGTYMAEVFPFCHGTPTETSVSRSASGTAPATSTTER